MQKNNDIIHTKDINAEIKEILKEYKNEKILLLTDNNCYKYCIPLIKNELLKDIKVLEINSGEKFKNFKTLQTIWDFLIEQNVGRKSLLINLGGGVITDIGGFAASTFKRGINFINIPTSLLAQVDASIGGKTGINYKNLKNEIGIINQPKKVIIHSSFLKTLKKDEFLSGFAEMIKHSLIYNKEHYFELKSYYFNNFKSNEFDKIYNLIKKSVKVKEHFIKNFGHAFESYFIGKNKTILKHGFAVAYGIICELYLSVKKLNFSEQDFKQIYTFILEVFGKLKINSEKFEVIFQYMKHDKKNKSGEIICVLLNETYNASTGNKISKKDIIETLFFLNKI